MDKYFHENVNEKPSYNQGMASLYTNLPEIDKN